MLPRLRHNFFHTWCLAWLVAVPGIAFFSACATEEEQYAADRLNEISYAYHYRSLDSTEVYAQQAMKACRHYSGGRAEALNNLAFVAIAKMNYDEAYALLDSMQTDNQVELLIADVQRMRLCQRQSRNKNFYDYRGKALTRLKRIEEERNRLSAHQQRRLVYGKSELAIVASTYFYYVGQHELSVESLQHIDPNGEVEQDTAQLLNYYYNVGSGGIIAHSSADETARIEFDYLLRCYLMAQQHDYAFFEAQALQALSEHLNTPEQRDELLAANMPAMKFINTDGMPDELLAGNLAQRALDIFADYGDVYQTAGAYRTLAECYWEIGDYASAEICLFNALNRDTVINRAPDLIASIREQLCLVYSAVDDKQRSDFNRNIYLDLQEQTRQDRQLEARAAQLDASSKQLNLMIAAVVLAIVAVVSSLFIFDFLRRRSNRRFSLSSLMEPLQEWKQQEEEKRQKILEQHEELKNQIALAQLHLAENRKRNIEQRAKLSLVNSITPLIERMLNEVRHLLFHTEPQPLSEERLAYIHELTDEINECNDVLTNWIQMRQGEISLRIESFRLQELFDTLQRGRMTFQLKDVELCVKPTEAVVKADKTLTLFMLNTLTDNARKFTPAGGKVVVSASVCERYVEISVSDTGIGMTEDALAHLFDHKPIRDSQTLRPAEIGIANQTIPSHGFGLMNCKGIIEKYRKISQIFKVCEIGASSRQGGGTRLFFRLPCGVVRRFQALLLMLCLAGMPATLMAAQPATLKAAQPLTTEQRLVKAQAWADSAYFANINGSYAKTLAFADSCFALLGNNFLGDANVTASDSIRYYHIVLDVRNESAVAALALHEWGLYRYNNKLYTQLFRQLSADNTLESYCRIMQRSETNKSVAVAMLVILLIMLFPAYYLLYYRHRLYYRYSVERVRGINRVLLSSEPVQEKLQHIKTLWNFPHKQVNAAKAQQLDRVVKEICQALTNSLAAHSSDRNNMEIAADELRRVQYENDRLYICNNVLDNCLSTLKHETMYYPSRIQQLIVKPLSGSNNTDREEMLRTLFEVIAYYHELYSLLSAQAYRQVEKPLHIGAADLHYLLDLLQKLNGNVTPQLEVKPLDSKYVVLCLTMNKLMLNEQQCKQLFTPATTNVSYLICRQIIRELGEQNSARACGISAHLGTAAVPVIEITITQSIYATIQNHHC